MSGGTYGTLCSVGFEGTLWRRAYDLRLRIALLHRRDANCSAGGGVVLYRALTQDLVAGIYQLRIEGFDPERRRVTGTRETTVTVPPSGA